MKSHVSGCLGFIVGVFVALGIIFAVLVPFGIHKTDSGRTLIAILMLAGPFAFAGLFEKYAPKHYRSNQYLTDDGRYVSEEHYEAMQELSKRVFKQDLEALEEQQRELRKTIDERKEDERK
jgi:hypothetical protein